MGAGKRVRITIEADSSFVRMLAAKVRFAGFAEGKELDPAGVLALVACAEMRGGHEHEVDALIPQEWRDSLSVIHEERRVVEAPEEEEVAS